MSREVNSIAGRLSLRQPQRDSLEILDRVCEIAPPKKGADLEAALRVIHDEYPTVTDFERDFPSLCFALATGVGKTRLMGAFIAYMYQTGRSRHFFVLAPNLTIYNKLIADFTPGTPKYVFQGLSAFATIPPVVVTGDNYDTGIGVRAETRVGAQGRLFEEAVHINVFNISKINKEVRSSARGNGAPRIKRLAEYIGESYYDYLAALPDLVLLMDEAHRYRADAGMKAINELHPILGMELTATPFVESARGPEWFKNIACSYSLSQAIDDGFVKQPAVATRKDFDSKAHSDEELERIKLEDGIRLHEQVKTDLLIYANEHDKPVVKPFMLVIARDTTHASSLIEMFKSETFFEGRYADRVIEVHSALKGDEKEETVERLLAVESPEEPTEIVIHVNMLKEGWDVTNLYTIVPLRAANARTLIEQSIGRGLRLPFGRRTGVQAVDRLTIVAHDKFQEIVDEANREGSVIRRIDTIELDKDGAPNAPQPVAVKPVIEQILGVHAPEPEPVLEGAEQGAEARKAPKPVFESPTDKAIASATLKAITEKTRLPSATKLLEPAVQKEIAEKVRLTVPTAQQEDLPGFSESIEEVVSKATEAYVERSIDVPTITVIPTGEVTITYGEFDLDIGNIHLQPVKEEILVQHLKTHEREHLTTVGGGVREARLEDHVVSALIGFDDVDYDSTADLLYKLAGQLLDHLRSYISDEEDIRNVLIYYQRHIGRLVHAQMAAHRREHATGYEAKVLSGHRPLEPQTFPVRPSEKIRHFRELVEDKRRISQMLFGGFQKCLYPHQKFHSDSERRFAVVLESDRDVQKWVKPGRTAFQIQLKGGSLYEPDFVVEATDGLYLCEVKQANMLEDEEVLSKADAAIVWCRHATEYTQTTSGKPWKYLLIPDAEIKEQMSLGFLAGQYAKAEERTPAEIIPFHRIEPADALPFENCVPVYDDLLIAAGSFGEESAINEISGDGTIENLDEYQWAALPPPSRHERGTFVARVIGESMNRRIPNGSWCLWRLAPKGSQQGKVVLAQHRDIQDAEVGGQYTVKIYESEKEQSDDGSWRHTRIVLSPDSSDATFEPIVLEGESGHEVRVLAELIRVLR